MVSEPINSSLFHQLAEQLQQQNLEQFQKQFLEHQQHQQKVGEIYSHGALLQLGFSGLMCWSLAWFNRATSLW